jgi:hypothetical protein
MKAVHFIGSSELKRALPRHEELYNPCKQTERR